MARPSKSPEFWAVVKADYQTNLYSNRSLADRHDISETAIRKKAKAEEWIKTPSRVKREIVEAKMYAGVGNQSTYDALTLGADEDVRDMNSGLENARTALALLKSRLDYALDPDPEEDPQGLKVVEIKIILESNKLAIETIRKIRGLDSETGADYEEVIATLATGL